MLHRRLNVNGYMDSINNTKAIRPNNYKLVCSIIIYNTRLNYFNNQSINKITGVQNGYI